MADSVDRVFAQALRTVRRLPRPGSTRPPPAARLRLYGLYKQSMEGDVEAVLPRPSLQSTPPLIAAAAANDDAQQSQLKRERELRDEIEKWDAWRACARLSRTEAKRRYIEVLIQTMKVYAAGTAEARELVEELEFVWNQIRSQSGSEESLRNTARAGAGSGKGTGEDEEGRLRVLSPVSRGGGGEIVEGEDASMPEREDPRTPDDDGDGDGDDDDEEDGFRDTRLEGSDRNVQRPLDRRRRRHPSQGTRKWRHQIETALTKISTETAALREQIEELNSSSSYNRSSFGIGRRKGGRSVMAWMRWLLSLALRQMAINALVLAVLLVWGVWKGDQRFEKWVQRRWGQSRRVVEVLKLRWDASWKWDWAGMVIRLVPARFL